METRLTTALAGRYTVDREIGRGGMATVYLARDVRHNRNVALKVLSPELGAVLGVERFLAEIQVTANLQHPNLLPLFDSGEAGGLLFYVMPYVEGESLRKRLLREKQLPVGEAVRIACAIAGALDYAHRHNVIHRDLKPENILMQEGQPLIADFGIALAVSNAGGERITQTGLSLGTPQYMSPEQATGDRVVDGRTDIYSLGAMTYEMLVGDPPHSASTAQAVIAKVLTERPTSSRLSRPTIPPHVDATIARSLEKLAADRFDTVKEFADSLDGKVAISAPSVSGVRPAWGGVKLGWRGMRTRELAAWGLVAALAASVVIANWQLQRPVVESPVVRVNFDLPAGTRIQDAVAGPTLAVSPTGDMIAFLAIGPKGFELYARRVNEMAARQISGSAGRSLAFAPNGRWLAFAEGNEIKKVSVDGGQTFSVTPAINALPAGLAWSASDTIYVGSFSGMFAVPAAGGPATLVTTDTTRSRFGARWPMLLPDGKTIAFASLNSAADQPRLGVLTIATRKVVEYDVTVAQPLRVLGDQLVFVSASGGLMALRFDASANKPLGDPVQLDDGVLIDPTFGAKAALSESGTLAYLRGRSEVHPIFVARTGGAPRPLSIEAGNFANPRLSPDGRRVAMTVFGTNATDVWIYDIPGNTFTRFTFEGTNIRPEWSPDGKRVVFMSTRGGKTGIWWRPADGSGPAELLYQPELETFEALISPDGKWLVFRTAPGAKFSRDIFVVPMTGERKAVPLVVSQYSENLMRLSPDGKWLAYQSNETGRYEIYVRPFPGEGARNLVSDRGGNEPVWGRNGRTLYYRDQSSGVVEVDVTTGARFTVGARRVALAGDFLTDASHASYDVAADGRFLMLKRAGAEAQTIVVHNWARELREKTAPRK